MRKSTLLLLILFVVSLFATIVVVAPEIISPGRAPSGEKRTAQESRCVPSSLAGQPLVNGLSAKVQVPLFPGARRLTFAETGAAQYVAKAYDSEIFSFYQDRMRALCWEVKEQRQNQVVYKKDSTEVRVSLLPNPAGRTVIDYAVLASEGVLGTVRIAQAITCGSNETYCNGGCVASGTSCPAPTSGADCKNGTIYCSSTAGGSGWYQMSGPCPSTGTGSGSGTGGCSSGYYWCSSSNACIPTTQSCGTTGGTYEDTQAKCTDGIDNDGDNLIDSSDPGCSAFSGSSSWPTDQATCTSRGYNWCTTAGSTSGGWCQSTTCPSSTSGSGTYEDTQVKCTDGVDNDGDTFIDMADPSCSAFRTGGSCSSGYYWCSSSNACIPTTQSCGTTGGTYEDTQAKCTDGIDNDGDNLIDSSDPGCSAFTTSGTPQCSDGRDNDNDGTIDYPADTSCYGREDTDEFYPSSTGSCSSGYYWCGQTSNCIPNSQSCSGTYVGGCRGYTTQSSCTTVSGCVWYNHYDGTHCDDAAHGGGTQTGGSGGDANSCPSFAYSRWDSSSRRYCQLNSERKCDYNYPSYLTNGANYKVENCPATDSTTSGCPSGQYMCNGACVSNNTSCSSTSWPNDQASCTSQGKFWCTSSSGGGSGWCQNTACSTNYTTTTCPSGQWLCNNACISTSTQCNGYYYSGGQTTTQTSCPSGQNWCSFTNSCIPSTQSCTAATVPTGTTCAGGYTWCAYENGCIPSTRPCLATTPQPTQPQPPYPQQPPTPPPYPPGGDQYGYPGGPGGPGGPYGPSEEDMKRMKEEQFRMMKRGAEQFARGINQMKRFVDRMKTKLGRQGVGLPTELTNALAKAPELLAKLRSAKDQEEFEDLMGDMQDIGMIMQEWGPKLGELERLASMLTNLTRDVRNMSQAYNRAKNSAKRRPELADAVKELEAMLGVMSKRAADAKTLAKTDPEGALDLVEDFYGNTEEYWNQVSLVEMVSNVQRALTEANRQLRNAESRIRNLERGKRVEAEVIVELKAMLADIKSFLPELRRVVVARPIDYEAVRDTAEEFWSKIQEFENFMTEQGQSFYAPTVRAGQGIEIDIPEGFIAPASPTTAVPAESAPVGF